MDLWVIYLSWALTLAIGAVCVALASFRRTRAWLDGYAGKRVCIGMAAGALFAIRGAADADECGLYVFVAVVAIGVFAIVLIAREDEEAGRAEGRRFG